MSDQHTPLTAVREGIQDANRGLAALTRAGGALDFGTAELVKVRVSQINGCAYCVDLHAGTAAEAGEDHRRLHALAVWEESPFFTARERAALALAEALTVPPMGPIDPAVALEVEREFPEADERNALVATIIGINAWNRVMISDGAQPPALGD